MPGIRPQQVQVLSHLRRAQTLQTAPFTYDLPSERIASHPLRTRHDAKLLAVSRGGPSPRDFRFSDLPSLLPRSSLVVRNATRVIPARIPVYKATGGRAEVLLLNPCAGIEPHTALSSPTTGQCWEALLGGRNLRVGDLLSAERSHDANGPAVRFEATISDKQAGVSASVSLSAQPPLPLRAVLARLGLPPLPPYIRRPTNANDRLSFQTVYAAHDGSAAAPTAGLHVTPVVLEHLRRRDIEVADVVLHIGTATFRQVSADVAGGHDMHHESVSVPGHVVNSLVHHLRNELPIVALGTTSVRTLESLYWFGVRLLTDPSTAKEDLLSVEQWEPYYQMDRLDMQLPAPLDSLSAVLQWCGGSEGAIHGGTKLLIVPGYPFMMTNALVTNFHQPRSTLLMLVSAFYGGSPDDLAIVYKHALTNNYRFLSYGDSSIYADVDFFDR